jgi:hypothetical protein
VNFESVLSRLKVEAFFLFLWGLVARVESFSYFN